MTAPVRLVAIDQLVAVMPSLEPARAQAFIGPLNSAMFEFEIISRRQIAAFLAQLAHESTELRYWLEQRHWRVVKGCKMCRESGPHDAGVQYEGRVDLGNTQPGDGVRYLGRGPIQLTGRANYRAAGKAIGVDLEHQSMLAAAPVYAFRIAGWFWQSRGLNPLADAGEFVRITKLINGGLTDLEKRERYWSKAKAVFDVQ